MEGRNDFRGRLNRIPESKRRILYSQVENRLKKHTIIIFLDKIKEYLLNEANFKRIAGSFYWIDASMLFFTLASLL